MKNKLVAALLGIFGGSFGLHKFYLGDSGAGIFYVFLTMMTWGVFPISLFLGLIDGMRYLMMPPEEFDRKFNKRYRKRRRPSRKRTAPRRAEYRKSKRKERPSRLRSNPFKKSGLKKYREYDIEEAIIDFQKALKIDPKDASLYFNLACAYSLMEDKDEAYKHLELAVMHGLTDDQRIMSHDDLAYVRIQPDFEQFKLNGYKRTQEMIPVEEAPIQGKKPSEDILLAQLNRLVELRKKGVLTEQEFLRERKKVLAR